MKNNTGKNFTTGVIIGTLVCLLYWYYQKSTKAEDGALDLLQRLKEREDQLRQRITSSVSVSSQSNEPPSAKQKSTDDLTRIHGVGAVFSQRFNEAGVNSIAQVAKLSSEKVADILGISTGRAENILENARTHTA